MGKNKRKRSHTKRVFVRKKYRDALFRRIFNEKSVLLELYNALNHTHYDDADELIFYTIDDVIYLGYKNDVSFIVRGTLNLYEHQSTLNPNMPIRGLIYFGKQYESYIKQNNLNIYGKKLLLLPFPQFVIFYNGVEPLEDCKDYMELHLSDAFEYARQTPVKNDATFNQQNTFSADATVSDSGAQNMPGAVGTRPCLECTARVYNINYGHNQELMARCRTLRGIFHSDRQNFFECQKRHSIRTGSRCRCTEMYQRWYSAGFSHQTQIGGRWYVIGRIRYG